MKQVNPTEARQGREGKPVLVVLLVSIAAALVVWVLVEIYGAVISPMTIPRMARIPCHPLRRKRFRQHRRNNPFS